MTIVRRTLLGYGGLTLLVLVIAALGMIAVYWLDSSFKDHNETSRAQIEGAAAIREASLPMGYIARAAVLADTPGDRTRYEMELEAASAATTAAIDEMIAIEATAGDGNDSQLLESMITSLETYHTELTRVIDSSSTDEAAALNELRMEVEPLGRAFNDSVHSYEVLQRMQELESAENLSSTGERIVIGMAVVVLLAIVAGALLPVLTTRKVGRQLRAAVTSLGSSSAEILAVVSQVAASAAQTAASTNETTVTVEEVKQTAVLAHEKSSSAAEGAQRANQMIEAARVSMDETVSSMERMQGQMDLVSQTIDRLDEQTQAAGDVIASVNDLAEQSNLLSVNASIEAAKAGEYGKGFTVVAQEVKSLAEQSKQAVAQVRTMLSEMQKAGRTGVEAAAQGRETVEVARQQSMETSDVLRDLVVGAADDAQASLQVTASSQQQLAGMEQIAQAIVSINQATAQGVSGTRQVEQEAKRLRELAISLRSLVETGGGVDLDTPPATEE